MILIAQPVEINVYYSCQLCVNCGALPDYTANNRGVTYMSKFEFSINPKWKNMLWCMPNPNQVLVLINYFD